MFPIVNNKIKDKKKDNPYKKIRNGLRKINLISRTILVIKNTELLFIN